MSTNYGFIILNNGKRGMVHLLTPVTFKGNSIYYHIGWESDKKVERLTDKEIKSFTYCSK